MNVKTLKETLGTIDIYLLDQVLKDQILSDYKILDAGCGSGRNMHFFIKNNYQISGIDNDVKKIQKLQRTYGENLFQVANLEAIPFKEHTFDYIICNAVLHFSKNEAQFFGMLSELFRVIKPQGTLFIRMTAIFGVEKYVKEIANGVYKLGDGTDRFLLTQKLLDRLETSYNIEFIAPIKTVNVANKRAMTTLIIKKTVTM